MKKIVLSIALAGLLAGTAAVAQVTLTPIPNVNPATDLFQDVVGGAPTAASKYALGRQVTGVAGYHNGGAAATAWTYTFKAGEQYFFIQPAGTLATGALTTEASPGPGQRECFFSTHTQTALTWTANTGQSLDASVGSAGVASTLQCIIYDSATTTWFAIQ